MPAGTSTATVSPVRPRIRCFVGQERHDTIDLGLRYLGLGHPTVVPSDRQGRIIPAELDCALDLALSAGEDGRPAPALVCLQAGNLHSGAFDPFAEAIAVAKAHGAWVHVDGAFGLWAAAVPELSALTAGLGLADSWGTDAHKTLNVPYDCGIVIVRDAQALRSAMGLHTSYLIQAADGAGDPFESVPELSRRARGVPVWAALKSLGRDGVAGQVRTLVHAGRAAGRTARRAGRRRGAQRRRLHPGVPGVRRRRRDPRRDGDDHGRRPGLDVRVALAGPRYPADFGEQLEHGRRRCQSRRRRRPRRLAAVRG